MPAAPPQPFSARAPDAAGVLTWIHIGDLHMTDAGEQNHLDLVTIIAEINAAFANSVAFVYIPGDVADQGSAAQYTVVRNALDALTVPWCSIVGDHDVHEKSFANYLKAMAPATYYAFESGSVRFLALNAFDEPHPASFAILPAQLAWIEQQLAQAEEQGQTCVLLLHCYPSDLKQGGPALMQLTARPSVRLIDMGHTHYNELANDGRTLYTATRSTGQIEEGSVGYSVTNIDGAVISWKFLALGELPAVMFTSPADERCITDSTLAAHISEDTIVVRAKAWGTSPIRRVVARLDGREEPLRPVADSRVWQGEFTRDGLNDGIYDLSVTVEDAHGASATDTIRIVMGRTAYQAPTRAERDQDNTVGAWPERGLLGTQLGPNKNGRKW